jgi:hypothetical protein
MAETAVLAGRSTNISPGRRGNDQVVNGQTEVTQALRVTLPPTGVLPACSSGVQALQAFLNRGKGALKVKHNLRVEFEKVA